MSRNYKFHNPEGTYFVSFTIVFWISVFIRECYLDILIKNLKYCQENKGLNLHAFCIMPNHVHLIFSSSLHKPSDLLRDYKKATTREIIKTIQSNYKESRKDWMLWMLRYAASKDTRKSQHKFWQYHSHPIEIWSDYLFKKKLNYIHRNPVKEGYVSQPEYWKYSSARNYLLNDHSLINVDIIH